MTNSPDAKRNSSSRCRVELDYSCDYLSIGKEQEKVAMLYSGGDVVTRVLNHFKIPYEINLLSDFHASEPELRKVTKCDKHGIEYVIYDWWRSLDKINSQSHVIDALHLFGVIPCTSEEAIKIGESKK